MVSVGAPGKRPRNRHRAGAAARTRWCIRVLACWLASASCASSGPEVDPDDFAALADPGQQVSALFTLTVDPAHPALRTDLRQPQRGPVTVAGASEQMRLEVHARTVPVRPGLLWLDLYLENRSGAALRGLRARLRPRDRGLAVIDVTGDPMHEARLDGPVEVGGVAAEGLAHLAVAVPVRDASYEIELEITGTTTTRTVHSSSPIQLSPDGRELWVVAADADTVAVIETASGRRVAQLAVPGSPRSVALTADGATALVASAHANTVTVIDRASRRIVQVLGEADGIGREPRHLVTSADGADAYLSAYVGDTVTALRRRNDGSFRVRGRVAVGRRPLGMSLAPDGKTLLVSHFLPRGPLPDNEAWLSAVDTRKLTLREVVFRDDANLRESECLARRFGVDAADLVFEGVSVQLAGAFFAPGGALAWVPALRLGPIPVWEVQREQRIPGVIPARFAPSFVLFVDTRGAARPKLHSLLVDIPDADPGYLRCARLAHDSESASRQELPDRPGEQYNQGAAIPAGNSGLDESGASRFVAFSRGGRRAFVLSYVADEVQVFDATSLHPTTRRNFPLSGANPIGMAISPDGTRGYVAYENSLFVSVLDLTGYAGPGELPGVSYVPFEYRDVPGYQSNSVVTRLALVRHTAGLPELPAMRELGQIAVVDRDPLDPVMRRGRILFTSSSPDKYPGLSGSRQAACVSCHPDGGHDGVGWGTMEGERRTVSLRGGVGGRGWLHQSATHQNALEFVDLVTRERLGGAGLAPEDATALARYLAWGIPRLQSPAVVEDRARRGQELFAARCAGCHRGPALTSGNPDPDDPYGGGAASGPALFDVGTAADDMKLILPRTFSQLLRQPARDLYAAVRGDRALGQDDMVQQVLQFRRRPERPRGMFRAPGLVNVWDNVLFFHDGRYTSLEQVLQHLDRHLALGLGRDERRDLIEYLKTL